VKKRDAGLRVASVSAVLKGAPRLGFAAGKGAASALIRQGEKRKKEDGRFPVSTLRPVLRLRKGFELLRGRMISFCKEGRKGRKRKKGCVTFYL